MSSSIISNLSIATFDCSLPCKYITTYFWAIYYPAIYGIFILNVAKIFPNSYLFFLPPFLKALVSLLKFDILPIFNDTEFFFSAG